MILSVIMATFNGSGYIKEQIDSILSQSIQDFELVVCDDCSTDDTWSILNEYALKDSRIHIYRNENNIGINRNFEKGILYSQGNYVALCDQDDIWPPDRLEILLSTIGDKMIATGDAAVIDEEGKPTGWLYSKITGLYHFPKNDLTRALIYIFNQNQAQGATMLIRREFFSKALPLPDMDGYYDAWFAILSCFAGGMNYSPLVVTLYRKHDKNVSSPPLREKKVYQSFLSRTVQGCYSHKEFYLTEVQNRVTELSPKEKVFIFLCKRMMHRVRSVPGRIINVLIILPFFRVIYQKSPIGLVKPAWDRIKKRVRRSIKK